MENILTQSSVQPSTPADMSVAEQQKAQKLAQQTLFDTPLVNALDVLSADCAQWEAGAYTTATEGLYELLGRCLTIYRSHFIQGTPGERTAFRKALMTRIQTAGVRVTKSTMTLTMFVRYIFKSDRRRAHGYSYVLRAAVEQDIAAEGFAEFVRQAGGIEELRRKMVISEEAAARRQLKQDAKADIEAEIEDATLNPFAEIDAPDDVDLGTFCLVLGVGAAPGRIGLVKVLGNTPKSILERIKQLMANHKLELAAQQPQHNEELSAMKAPSAMAKLAA
jgi:hypothetical protein